jgi:DNA-binding response OmpR family regulator
MTAKPGKGHRVLVVGCEPALVRYFAVFLKIFGYQVSTAKSFPEAIREAQKHPPDTLITMILMPCMSGVEIGLRIFRRSQCSVLFVTAMDEQANMPYWDAQLSGRVDHSTLKARVRLNR